MSEDQSQHAFDARLQNDNDFRRLYFHHQKLDKKVADATLGILPIDDQLLACMKREKLQAKDRLTRMLNSNTH